MRTGLGSGPGWGILVAIRTVYIILSSTRSSQNLYFDLISYRRLHVGQRFKVYNDASRERSTWVFAVLPTMTVAPPVLSEVVESD